MMDVLVVNSNLEQKRRKEEEKKILSRMDATSQLPGEASMKLLLHWKQPIQTLLQAFLSLCVQKDNNTINEKDSCRIGV